MSHSYSTRTFSVAADRLPATFASLAEFDAFAKDAGGAAHDRADGLHHLWGDTRSGWAIYITKKLLESLPDATALGFLTDEATTIKFEDEHGFTAVSVLAPQAVTRAADRLADLLRTLQADPMPLYRAEYAGVFNADVEAALARDYTSNNPRFDPQVGGDEGQSADYLCTYWRSMLALLRTAERDGLGVVHSLTV